MPTVTLEAQKDAVMAKALGGTFSGWNGKDNHIQVGATANRKWRGVIKFSLGDTSNWGSVSSAILTLTCFSDETNHESGTGNTMELKYARMTSDWGEGAIDPGEGDASGAMDWHWDNRYDKWTNDSRQNVTQGSTGVTRTLDLTSIVNDWVIGGKTNYGIILMNGTSENDVDKAFLFYSTNTGSAGNRPQLQIVYTVNTAPSASTGMAPTGDAVVSSLVPSFSFTLSDPDAGDYLTGCWIQVVDDAGTTVYWDSAKITVAAGMPQSLSIQYGNGSVIGGNGQTLPLVAGNYYKWRVIAYDKAGAASPWTSYQRFFVNQSPSVPSVTVSPAPLSAVPDNTPNISVTHNDSPSDSVMHGYAVIVETESTPGAGDWSQEWASGDVDVSGSPVSTAIVTTGTLPWGASCRVTARTQDSYGAWSSYSPWVAFTIISVGVPINLQPTDSEVVSATPTLSGARSSSSDTIAAYWLRVFSDDLQTTMLTATRYTTGILNGTTFSKLYAGSALSAGASYQWQAQVESPSGDISPWSTLQRFTVAAATVPTATAPVGDNSYTLTPTITWTRASVFNRIQFEIYPEASTSSNLGTVHYASGTVSSGITGAGPTTYSATYAGTALVYNTGYKQRARVSNDGGSTWSSWSGLSWFKTASASAPTLTSVAGDSSNPAWITDDTPDFIIARGGADTIDKARIRVFDSSAVLVWDSGLIDVANATTATVTYAGSTLVPGSTYIWDANYQAASGPEGPYSTSKQFRLNGPPQVPSGLFPSPAYVYTSTETKTFTAVFADPDTSNFADYPTNWEIVIETGDSAAFDTENITTSLANGLNTRTWPGTTLNAGDYRWRTRFQDSKSIWGTYSAWQSFTVAAPPNGTIDTPSNGSTVTSITPTITWTYTGGTQAYYTIDIRQTDSSGAVLKNVTSLGPYYGTETSRSIPAGYLATGKYYNITLTVTSTLGLSDPTPSTVNMLVQIDAPNPITGVDTIANENLSSVLLTWNETTLKSGHTFIAYRVYRRRPNITDWELAGDVFKIEKTSFTDWYAGNTVTYQYVVRGVTTKSAVGVEMESPDDPNGGSFGETAISNDNWTFVGADRSPEHVANLAVTDESHNRPIQQEVFETLGSSRKVIMRGFVLGHEGSITTIWLNREVTLPEDEQITTLDTVVGRRLVNYLTFHAGPHILKSPFGDVWDSQFTSPEYRWLQTGHLEVTLEYVETGNTSMGEI
jgi:hypothetical protein